VLSLRAHARVLACNAHWCAMAGSRAHDARQKQLFDLGFDDDAACSPELEEEVQALRTEVAELKKALEDAKTNEARTTQKLASFQGVNRSQNSLMRAELQKSRRKLVHMQAVVKRLNEQGTWLLAQSSGLRLPPELQGLPSEEDAADEEEALLKAHRRWESDVVQLQAELLAAEARPNVPSPELEEARRQVQELQAEREKQKMDSEKQLRHLAKELQRAQQAAAAPQQAVPAAVPPPPAPAVTGSNAGNEEIGLLKNQLEAAEEKSKEQMKKLKQLAAAYKKLEQAKAEIDGKLQATEKEMEAARADAAKPKEPQRKPLSAAVVGRVQSMLAANRQELTKLKASVAADLQQQLPVLAEEVLKSKMGDISALVEAGAKEWRDKYEAESTRRRKLHNIVQELKGNIRVYVRVRPLAAHESGTCLTFPNGDEITITNENHGSKKTFQFNEVFRENSTQVQLFEGVRDLVVSMIDGYNVCIFAYGQTGAGKTHSMQGTPTDPGIYMRTFNELFKVARERSGWRVELTAAIIEIYNEEIRDLLVPPDKKAPKLQVRQEKGRNHVPGLTLEPVSTPEDVDNLLSTGQQHRTVACTDMNAHSSRSHLMVQIHGSMTTSEGKELRSCITLVDLAGSERLAKSGVSGDRAKEAIAINKSLSALGDVINSRATKGAHTPFRNSPLTHLLQDSLSGDSKTLMLLQMNPCQDHVEETMCSLNFGARVNNVEMKK